MQFETGANIWNEKESGRRKHFLTSIEDKLSEQSHIVYKIKINENGSVAWTS